MKIEPDALVLAITAGALLVGAGALRLRSRAPAKGAAPGEQPSEPAAPTPTEAELLQRVKQAEQAVDMLMVQLANSNVVREQQRTAMTELRQRLDQQLPAAEAAVNRLSADLEAEKERVALLEQWLDEAKDESKRARDDLARLRDSAAFASEGEKPDAGVEHERHSMRVLHAQVASLAQERDAALAKVQAVERLMEAVRARSRELAEELTALKKQ